MLQYFTEKDGSTDNGKKMSAKVMVDKSNKMVKISVCLLHFS